MQVEIMASQVKKIHIKSKNDDSIYDNKSELINYDLSFQHKKV